MKQKLKPQALNINPEHNNTFYCGLNYTLETENKPSSLMRVEPHKTAQRLARKEKSSQSYQLEIVSATLITMK